MMNITTTISSSIALPKHYRRFRIIQNVLVRISLPYIFLVASIGLVTNTLTVILLSKNSVTKNLRNKWTLIALALSDLLFNIVLLVRGLDDVVYWKNDHLCQVISALSHLAEFLSAYFTVSFTVQRFAAVYHPFQAAAQRHSSPIISLLLIFILSSIFCFILIHRNTYVGCQEELALGWFIADALLSFVIPFVLISTFNIMIVNFIRKHARSQISVQSTLIRRHKRTLDRSPGGSSRRGRIRGDPILETCLNDGGPVALHRQPLETETNTKVNPIRALIVSDDDDDNSDEQTQLKKQIPIKKNYPIIEPSLSISSTETANSALPSIRQSMPFVVNQLHDDHNKQQRNSFRLRALHSSPSCQGSDVDFVLTNNTPTAQSIRVTRILILVSTCFLVLNAPAHLCVIALKFYTGVDSPVHIEHATLDDFKRSQNLTNDESNNLVFIHNNLDPEHMSNRTFLPLTREHYQVIDDDPIAIHLLYIAVVLTQSISYASYSLNFFLYSYSGITFRSSLRQLFKKITQHR